MVFFFFLDVTPAESKSTAITLRLKKTILALIDVVCTTLKTEDQPDASTSVVSSLGSCQAPGIGISFQSKNILILAEIQHP